MIILMKMMLMLMQYDNDNDGGDNDKHFKKWPTSKYHKNVQNHFDYPPGNDDDDDAFIIIIVELGVIVEWLTDDVKDTLYDHVGVLQ